MLPYTYVIPDDFIEDTRPAPRATVGPTGATEVGDWVDYYMCACHLEQAPALVQQVVSPIYLQSMSERADVACNPCITNRHFDGVTGCSCDTPLPRDL